MNDKNETPKIIRLAETDSTNNYLREQSAKARLKLGGVGSWEKFDVQYSFIS